MYTADDFVVIAAVNDRDILRACLMRSPDVASGQLAVKTVENARSMATAYNSALAETSAAICLLAHQDVYLPAGWLERAIACLNTLSIQAPNWKVAGPYGVTPAGRHVGRVWDVTMGQENGGRNFDPEPVGSLDELLLILRNDGTLNFDADLPDFHLYGTDIVQTALAMGGTAFAVELPVVHNNRPIASLRGGYAEAYAYTRRKWSSRLPIHTCICTLTYNPLPLWRSQWRRRHVKSRPPHLLADAPTVARAAGYE